MGEAVGDFFQAVLARLTTSAIYQLASVVAIAYASAPMLGVEFRPLVAVLSFPVLVWHGWGKESGEKRRRERQRRQQAINIAYDAVEMAYDDRVLNPAAQGNRYAILKNARDATDSVAQFIVKPPKRLEMEFDQDLLMLWLEVLRHARRGSD